MNGSVQSHKNKEPMIEINLKKHTYWDINKYLYCANIHFDSFCRQLDLVLSANNWSTSQNWPIQ